MSKVLELPPERLVLPRTHGFLSQFNSRPKVETINVSVAALTAGTDLALTVQAAFAEPVLVTDVSILGDGSPTGVDGSNTSVWTVNNGGAALVVQTFDATPAFPADNVLTSLGAVANALVSAGGRLELSVLNGTTAATPRTILVVSYVSLSNIFDGYKVIGDDGGSLTFVEDAPGRLSLVSGAANEDEIYLIRNRETFDFEDDKPLEFITRVAFAEADTDKINFAAGLADAVAADHLVDAGAGPLASYSGAMFFKVDGGTVWQFESSLVTAQTTTVLSHATPAGASDFHTLKIEARMRDATTVELIPYIDEAGGMDLKQCTDANGALVKHTLTLGTPTEMAAFLGLKAGSAAAETATVTWLSCHQKV